MYLRFKKLLFTFTFNVTLFLVLIMAIQNSTNKRKINLIMNETINLPISFFIGISFLSGSLTGSLVNTYFDDKNI